MGPYINTALCGVALGSEWMSGFVSSSSHLLVKCSAALTIVWGRMRPIAVAATVKASFNVCYLLNQTNWYIGQIVL